MLAVYLVPGTEISTQAEVKFRLLLQYLPVVLNTGADRVASSVNVISCGEHELEKNDLKMNGLYLS
jgi:hypothetical protein